MPLFRVQLVRRKALVDLPRNPFEARLDVFKPIPCTATYRQWEFKARNEAEVRKLFKEAVAQSLPNVLGFSIHSIERVDATASPQKDNS